MNTYVITIARGFGSGGKAIGVALGKELGIPCYESEILKMASEKSGLNEALFFERDEKLKGSYFSNLLKSTPSDYAVEPMDRKFTHDNNLYNLQKEIILELAQTKSCIIVGKCADNVLRNKSNVLKVFIGAPMKTCMKSIIARLGVDEEEAVRLINKTDKYRSDYYKYYTGGKDWRNPVNYDLCLNTGYLSREMCVEMIKHGIVKKIGEEV